MARFRFKGGAQQPDVYGVLEVGDVLEFDKKPDWGDWESTSEPAERAPTPQPSYTPAGPEPSGDEPAAPPAVDDTDDDAEEG
jgi:hypothetical protein